MRAWILRSSELDADLCRLWEEFRKSDPVYDSPFYSPHFTRLVGQARSDVRVALLEDRGTVTGFLPFHLVHNDVGKPIGGHISDYHGPILASGVKIEPAALLQAVGLAAYDFSHLPVAIAEFASRARAVSVSPQMDLSSGYDRYCAGRGSSWKKAQANMKRCWRKTENEVGPLRFTFHDPSEDVFRQHLDMKCALHRRLGIPADFFGGWVGSVMNAVRRTQLEEFAGVMSTLHAGDRLIAAHFGMRSNGVWHWWFPSYDRRLCHLGVGVNLIDQCARIAAEKQLRSIDFGVGASRYKTVFADRHVSLCEGSISRSGSTAAALRQASDTLVSWTGKLPLGRYGSYPRKAVARLISGVTLPRQPLSTRVHSRSNSPAAAESRECRIGRRSPC